MKQIIKSVQEYMCRVATIVVVFMFVFIVFPTVVDTVVDSNDSIFSTKIASAQWYDTDYGSYTGFGDAGYGCCDYSSIDYGGSSWYDTDYGSYTGFGDAGYGCCDYSSPDYSNTWYDTDYSDYTGFGDTIVYAQDTWYDTDYSDYTGFGDAGYGCCDTVDSVYVPPVYPEYVPPDYGIVSVPDYPVGVDYGSPYVYPSYSYSYPSYSYSSPGYSYSYPTYTYTAQTRQRPTCTLVADDDRLTRGESTRLVWNTSHSDNQEINQGIGDVADDGSRSVSPTRTTTYTLFVEGDGGTITCNETVFVDEPRNDLSCDSFSVNDSNVEEGDKVTLTWRTTGADDVDIDHGVGDVAEDGNEEVTMHDDTTFTLTARDGSDSVTCNVHVNVDENNNNNDNPRCDSFTVSDSKVDEGDKVTLKWRTTDADSVRIDNGVGSVDVDGEERVTVHDDTTFTLTARNGNDEDTCKVKVSVDEDNNNSNSLRCELTASDKSVRSGDEVKLSWDNRNADRIVLKDNHGKEIADSKDDKGVDEDTDSVKVHPKTDTNYTLTAYDGSKKKTCTVSVNVGDTTITSVRGQGTIPLSYTPYTGFDAGPTLTFIFYAAIALWGVFVGYALVLKKKAAVALSHGVASTVHAGVVASTATLHAPEVSVHEHNIPSNLPTSEMPSFVQAPEIDTLRILEERANAQSVLISSDALRLIESQNGTHEEQAATLDRVIALAKAQYPKENGWIVVNKEKIIALLG